ncbi:MAG TPA: outer membrane beta-barrel protein, partial [Candidatus Polarisedimenticolia bacterium]|nr:outer membrane beta-barrel protein [Candidatus Polarisedimenticolia bacterium]
MPDVRRISLSLLLALFAFGGTGAATVQDDFPVEGTFHWGPFRVRPTFQLRDTGYDSNVFLEDGREISDFTSTTQGGLKMFSLFRDRGVIQVEEVLDYVLYAQNGSLNHLNNLTRSKGAYYMKRGVVFAEFQYLSVRERPSTEIDYRVRRRESMLGTGWRFVWPHSSLQFRLGRDVFDYESGVEAGQNIPPALNRVEKRITVTGTRQLLPKTTGLLEWEGTRIDFDKEPTDIELDSDSSSRRFSGGLQFDPSAFIKGTLKVGVKRLEPDSRTREGYEGIVGDVALLYRFTGLTSLELRGRRGVEFTIASNNLYYLDRSYGATLTQKLADRVAGEVGIDRQR